MNRSKRRLELEVGKKVAEFLNEPLGEAPEDVITRIMEDTIMVKLKEAIPPAERHLMEESGGMRALKELKEKLIEDITPQLEHIIEELTASRVINSYSSIDRMSGDRILIFSMDGSIQL